MITRDHASKYFDTMADLILDCSLCSLKNSWVVITYTCYLRSVLASCIAA